MRQELVDNLSSNTELCTKEDVNNPYQGLIVCIDGNFSLYFDSKKQVKSILQKLGVQIDENLSPQVDIFIAGARVSNNVFEYLNELQEGGFDIELLFEFELYDKFRGLGVIEEHCPYFHEEGEIDINSGYTKNYIRQIDAQVSNAMQREENGNVYAAVPIYEKYATGAYKSLDALYRLMLYYHISRQYDREIEVIDVLINQLDINDVYYKKELEKYTLQKNKALRRKNKH